VKPLKHYEADGSHPDIIAASFWINLKHVGYDAGEQTSGDAYLRLSVRRRHRRDGTFTHCIREKKIIPFLPRSSPSSMAEAPHLHPPPSRAPERGGQLAFGWMDLSTLHRRLRVWRRDEMWIIIVVIVNILGLLKSLITR